MTADVLDRYRRLDVCAVSDAIDALGHGGGATGEIPRRWRAPRVCGRVQTMVVVDAPGARADRHLGVNAIARSSPGDVIMVQQRGELVAACWGGLLARAAMARGVAGVLIDGACRDLDEIEDLRLPLFARAVVPHTARRRVIEDTCGEPITFAGMSVAAGDIVIADGSGIAVVAQAAASEVLTVAEGVAAREEAMTHALEGGEPLAAVLGAAYEEVLDEPIAR